MPLRHFAIREFDSPDEPGSGVHMNQQTMVKLDAARARAGIPFRINSGFRTAAHNASVGGVPGSSHTKGYAVDISLNGFSQRQQLGVIAALVESGFSRLGISWGRFIHADDDPDKPSPAYWDYA
jgi:hypothetical protein